MKNIFFDFDFEFVIFEFKDMKNIFFDFDFDFEFDFVISIFQRYEKYIF